MSNCYNFHIYAHIYVIYPIYATYVFPSSLLFTYLHSHMSTCDVFTCSRLHTRATCDVFTRSRLHTRSRLVAEPSPRYDLLLAGLFLHRLPVTTPTILRSLTDLYLHRLLVTTPTIVDRSILVRLLVTGLVQRTLPL